MLINEAPMGEIVSEAWRIGRTIDLTGIGYGRIHWGNNTDTVEHPFPYYFFLAGLVRLIDAKTIVEVGTHYGGSARAMAAGFSSPGKIITFDKTADGAGILAGHPVIQAHTLDANTEDALNIALGEPHTDLVYLDGAHKFWPTMLNFAIYGDFLRPRFVVLDDIHLSPEMDRLWQLLSDRFGNDSIDANSIDPNIRSGGKDNPHSPGFGVIRGRR